MCNIAGIKHPPLTRGLPQLPPILSLYHGLNCAKIARFESCITHRQVALIPMSLSTTPAAPPPLTRPQLLRAVVLALVVLTALWGVFFWRVLTPTAEDRVIFNQQGDFVLHFYAPIAYQIERLQAGELPLWNPYNYAGEPSLANIQNGSFYPPRYLTALLAGPGHYTVQVYQVETALHYWLASLLMFAFVLARFRRVGLAILGGTLFAYRGYMTGYAMLQASTVATEAWLPLALLGVYLCMGRYRVGGALLAAIAVALMLLAGRPQAAFYLIVMVMAYLAYLAFETLQDGDSPRRVFIGFLTRALAIGGLGVALAAGGRVVFIRAGWWLVADLQS